MYSSMLMSRKIMNFVVIFVRLSKSTKIIGEFLGSLFKKAVL